MTMTEDVQGGPGGAEPGSARAVVAELAEAGLLDRVMAGAEAAVETTQPTTARPALPTSTRTTMMATRAWERCLPEYRRRRL